MANFLHRVGRWSFRRRRATALLWVAVVALAGVAMLTAEEPGDGDFRLPGTEAQKAFDLLDRRFPGGNAEGAEARLVFRAPDGQTLTAGPHRETVTRTLADLADGEHVASVADPYAADAVSRDGTIAYAAITYDQTPDRLADAATEDLTHAADEARRTGLTVEIGGDALSSEPSLGGITELIGVAVAVVVLLLTFGSLVAAGLPLLTAIVGVAVSFAVITALAAPLGLGSTAAILAVMLGLAVGIDYALFVTTRYRAERAAGREPEDAAGHAVGTAGSAVVFAGLTVIIALCGLAVVGVPELTQMGFAAAGAVAVAVLVGLTLVPAMLGFAGRRALPRARRKAGTAGVPRARGISADGRAEGDGSPEDVGAPEGGGTPKDDGGSEGIGARWARFVLRRPVLVLAASVLGLGTVALPVFGLELGLPSAASESTDTTQRRAYDLLSEGFGPGFNGPLTVVVDTEGVHRAQDVVEEVVAAVAGLDGVVALGEPRTDEAGMTTVLTAVPASGPNTAATKDLVAAIRATTSDLERETGAEILVTGTTALNVDISAALSAAVVPYLLVVVGLAVLLLMVVFRSVLVPVKAALGFLLSVGAALGVVVAVMQWGWLAEVFGVAQTAPVMSLMPVFIIGVSFGLAMDYEVFLVSRMREEYVRGASPEQAVVTGFRHSGRVVAAAAVIMVSVFGGFVGTADAVIKTMGLGLAFAVAFDAFVVRMAFVPAVLRLLGHRAWWLPRSLDRMLPNVDIEGASLAGPDRGRATVPAAATRGRTEPVRD